MIFNSIQVTNEIIILRLWHFFITYSIYSKITLETISARALSEGRWAINHIGVWFFFKLVSSLSFLYEIYSSPQMLFIVAKTTNTTTTKQMLLEELHTFTSQPTTISSYVRPWKVSVGYYCYAIIARSQRIFLRLLLHQKKIRHVCADRSHFPAVGIRSTAVSMPPSAAVIAGSKSQKIQNDTRPRYPLLLGFRTTQNLKRTLRSHV